MITIEGNARQDGVATAVCAVVNTQNGINGISPTLLQEGIRSIKMGLLRQDYPEAVIVSDNLAMGLSARIPGINIIGVASESFEDMPDQQIGIPCVTGLPGLLDSVNEGNIIIVDGNKGIVHIDPDPQTLIHYQELEERKLSSHRIFVSSEHIPAKTQTGHTINVYAYIADEPEVNNAMESGADGLIIDLREHLGDPTQYCESILRTAAGIPVFFIIDLYAEEALRTSMWLGVSGQVTLAFSPTSFDIRVNEIETMLIAMDNNPEATSVNIGTILEGDFSSEDIGAYPLLIDLRNSPLLMEQELDQQVKLWSGDMDEELLVLILDDLTKLEPLVNAGARCVAVAPNLISEAKYAIRSIGLEEVD